jgi:hypothetical protein
VTERPELRRAPGPNGNLLPSTVSTANEVPLAPFDPKQALEAIRHHWLTVLVIAALLVIPGSYRLYRTVPVYQAQATIRLRDLQGMLTGGLTGGTMGDLARSVDPVRSQIEVLTSRAVAAQVVDSTPELRISTDGFPPSALTDLHISAESQADSLSLDFLPAVVVASGSSGSASAVYRAPLYIGGVQFTIASAPAAHGVMPS